MDRAARLKQYFAPELGGTWDATAVNNNWWFDWQLR
jgi:hypothetical protein